MPTLMNMTAQNIEQTLTELTEAWIKENIHDFSLLRTSILENKPIPAIMDELRKHIQTLQQQEEARITQQLQITAIRTQTTNDEHEAIADKQEEHDDNVRVIASKIEGLRYQSSNMAQQKEHIKSTLEVVHHDKLNTKVKELINQALLNQIREDETQFKIDQRNAGADAALEDDLHAVEQKIIEAKARLTQKQQDVQDRIVELNNQHQDDPKQLKEKTGQSALDYINFGNWQNRDETLQKLRRHEKKATDALGELKANKKRLVQAIKTRPDREQQRQQRNEDRKSRKKARKAAAQHDLISSVLDALLNIQSETNFVLNHDVIQQLSTSNASYLQSAIGRARENLNHEFQVSIQQALSPIERKIVDGDGEIARLTEQLKGVSGRAERRRIQAENRQKRGEIRSQYPAPSTTGSGWEAQLSSDVSNKLSHDIGLEQCQVEQEAKNIYAQAQKKSWSLLFDIVRQKPGADADNKSIDTLKKICGHIAHHQQSLRELNQLESELAAMRGQVNEDVEQVRLLSAKIALNKQQIDRNNELNINRHELMQPDQSQVIRCEEENASLRTKTLGYAALAAVLLTTVAVIAVGFLPAGPIVGAILMSMFAIAAIVSINSYMEWGAASRDLEQRTRDLDGTKDAIENANESNRKLTRENDDLVEQIAALEGSISETNQHIAAQQDLIENKIYDANRSLELAQAMTPDNVDQLVSENDQPSAPPLATATVSQQGMFNGLPVAVPVAGPDSDFSMK